MSSKNQKNSRKNVAEAAAVEQPPAADTPVMTGEPVAEQPLQPVQVFELPLTAIVPNPANPRRYFDDGSLAELAQNIIEHGVLQPVTVREVDREDGKRYEIIFGERRFRAAAVAGLETVPCMVRSMDDNAAFDLMVSENLQRRDILPSEEGEAFKKILDRGYGMAYISERFGKSDSFIHSRLCLVRLIPGVAGMMDAGEISIGAAVEISRMEPEIQEHILKEHLQTDIAFNSWKHLPVKQFRERLEATYTVLLSRFSFDKSECAGCAYNSEIHSLFPVPENSRCTKTLCLVKKHEKHLLNSILAAAGDENLDVYISDGNAAGIHTEIIGRLAELGIEVKTGHVYPMPENPVMPEESDFEGDGAGYERAMEEFDTKRSKWNALQGMSKNGNARKVIVIKDLEAAAGYVMTVRKNENESGDGSRSITPGAEGNCDPDDVPNRPSEADGAGHSSVKPDLPATLEQKDRKNREEALCRVITDAKKLVKSVDIPPEPLTAFEDALLCYIMLAYLDSGHYEFFGIPEGKSVPEDVKLNLYGSLTDEQKNILKRDFLMENMVQGNGITKKAALLIELAKRRFPDEMAEIENTHNEEYLKKQAVLREQMEKLRPKVEEPEEMEEVA